MKKNILILSIGLLLGIAVTVVASYTYLASDVKFTPSEQNVENGLNVSNVEDAINQIYNDVQEEKTYVTNASIKSSGNLTLVSSLSGLEVGKTYIIYLRTNTDSVTISGADTIIPLTRYELISTENITYQHILVGIYKATSTKIKLSTSCVISVKQIK